MNPDEPNPTPHTDFRDSAPSQTPPVLGGENNLLHSRLVVILIAVALILLGVIGYFVYRDYRIRVELQEKAAAEEAARLQAEEARAAAERQAQEEFAKTERGIITTLVSDWAMLQSQFPVKPAGGASWGYPAFIQFLSPETILAEYGDGQTVRHSVLRFNAGTKELKLIATIDRADPLSPVKLSPVKWEDVQNTYGEKDFTARTYQLYKGAAGSTILPENWMFTEKNPLSGGITMALVATDGWKMFRSVANFVFEYPADFDIVSVKEGPSLRFASPACEFLVFPNYLEVSVSDRELQKEGWTTVPLEEGILAGTHRLGAHARYDREGRLQQVYADGYLPGDRMSISTKDRQPLSAECVNQFVTILSTLVP